jgi:hypothetical protein
MSNVLIYFKLIFNTSVKGYEISSEHGINFSLHILHLLNGTAYCQFWKMF